jgi:hypothetical protein
MKALIPAVLILICTASQAMASARTVTCFLDGAKVEYETGFNNGYMEVRLPSGLIKDSLRIKPVGDSAILRVEMHRAGTDRVTDKEIASLSVRKNTLADKIKGLDTKERVFAAAAKSQSGRALRRTKNNPEPLADIRKGTAFAVAQLESVLAQKRKCEKDLTAIDAKLSNLRTTKGADPEICTVWFSSKSGRARILYLTADRNWKPIYDFRLDGNGQVRMVMRALFNSEEKDSTYLVMPAKISDAGNVSFVPVPVSRPYDKVREYTFTVENKVLSLFPVNSLSFSFINGTDQQIPSGDASCYLQGEYVGGFTFKGAAPKETVTLSAGKLSEH